MFQRKPPKWGFDKGLTAPEWGWFWDRCLYATPLWSGTTHPQFLGRDAAIHNNNFTINGGVTVGGTTIGNGWEFNGSSSYLAFDQNIDTASGRTMFVTYDSNVSQSETLIGYADTGGAGAICRIGVFNKIPYAQVRTNNIGANTQLNANFAVNSREVWTVVFSWGGAVDGEMLFVMFNNKTTDSINGTLSVSTDSQTGTFTQLDNRTIGARRYNGTTNGYLSGAILQAGELAGKSSLAECLAIAQNPFGPFRYDDNVIPFAAAGATPRTLTLSADSLLQKQDILKTASADALLAKLGIEKTSSADALLLKTALLTLSADASLQKLVELTLVTDALLQKNVTLTASADAIVNSLAAKMVTTSADAILQILVNLNASADALLRLEGIEVAASADSLLQKTGTLTSSTDAILHARQILTFSTDALLLKQNVLLTVSANAILKSALAGAVIRHRGFLRNVGRMVG